jgi:hypothetical protein
MCFRTLGPIRQEIEIRKGTGAKRDLTKKPRYTGTVPVRWKTIGRDSLEKEGREQRYFSK